MSKVNTSGNSESSNIIKTSPTGASIEPQANNSGSTLSISSTQILPSLAKEIKTGDIINFILRGRNNDGLGILYLNGQLIQAKVPEHLNTGDRIKAQITSEGDKIIFKIIGITPKSIDKHNNSSLQAISESLVSITDSIRLQVENLLYKVSPFLPNDSLELKTSLPNQKAELPVISVKDNNFSKEISNLLDSLQNLLPSQQQITSGKDLLAFINVINKPETTALFKEIERELQGLLKDNKMPVEIKLVNSIYDQISKIFTDYKSGVIDTKIALELLNKMSNILEKELGKEDIFYSSDKNQNFINTFKISYTLIKNTILNEGKLNENLNKILNFIQEQHESVLAQNSGLNNQIPPALFKDLQTLSKTIEQFTSTQELLQRLEPVLQALKLPELILFPFIFEGLFAFGELVIDPDSKNRSKNRQDKDEDEGNEEGSKKKKIPVLQYHAQLPLPNLGLVRISSVHFEEEIELELFFDSEEKAGFVKENSNNLREEINKLGFSNLTVGTHNISGENKDILVKQSGQEP